MNVYRVFDITPGEHPTYCGTQAEAHSAAKGLDGSNYFPDQRIELVDVPTDKDSIIKLLNADPFNDPWPGTVLRTWRLGERGGMVECPNGE